METFTDPRDGNVYEIVRIGDLLWFAENLRYREILHCFPGRNSDNLYEYGCLYTWENAKEACPENWRLPTKDEFKQLLTVTGAYINPSRLRAPSWAHSSNSSKFRALPAGYRDSSHYYGFSSHADFWSATLRSNDHPYSLEVSSHDAYVYYTYISYALSIRCVKEIE